MRAIRVGVVALICGGLLIGVTLAVARPGHSGGGAPRVSAPNASVPSGCRPLAAGTRRIIVEGGRVPVVVHVPRGLRPGAPMVLGLPGAGQTAEAFASYTGYSRLADQQGFVVAYPTAIGSRPFWNITDARGKPDDVAYLREVIVGALRATCASPTRVGITGVSNGGGMAARLGCDAPDLIDAIAPVAGGYGALPACRPRRPVPVLEIHGVEDEVVPYEGKGQSRSGAVDAFLGQWRRLDGCSSRRTVRRVNAQVVELSWNACAGGTRVVHDRVADQDHGWPGESHLDDRYGFSATLATWRFLSAFRRRG